MSLAIHRQQNTAPIHFLTLPDDCSYSIFSKLIQPRDLCALGLTCKTLTASTENPQLWTAFFRCYMRSSPQNIISKKDFRKLVEERSEKWEPYVKSLNFADLEKLQMSIEGKSPFQKLRLIENEAELIFTLVCNSFQSGDFMLHLLDQRDSRSFVPLFMGYFNNELPLPSAETLSPLLYKMTAIEPFGACLYSYFKKNEASVLFQAISMLEGENRRVQMYQDIHRSILMFSKKATWKELFNQEFFMDFALSHKESFLCFFIKSCLQPVKNEEDKTQPMSHPLRLCSVNYLESRFPEANRTEFDYKTVKFIGEDSCPELGIDGKRFVYGTDPENDQLLEDFEALCAMPEIDLKAINQDGKSALQIAESLGMLDAVKVLQDATEKRSL